MEEILKILKQNDVEITDEIREGLSNVVEKISNPDNSLTQTEVNEMVRERLYREREAYESFLNIPETGVKVLANRIIHLTQKVIILIKLLIVTNHQKPKVY